MSGSSQAGVLRPEELAEAGIETVILATPDLQGRPYGKRLSTQAFLDRLEAGIQASTCALAWDYGQGLGVEVPYTGLHTGYHDITLRPDLASLRSAGWLERTAICLADAVEEESGEPVAISPRMIQRRQEERLRARGFEAVVGTELEFFLFRPGPTEARRAGFRGLEPTTLTHSDYAIQQGDALEPLFSELRACLHSSGIPLEMSQGEWGLGQWEMNLNHGPALCAADLHLYFKLAVKAVAARHGCTATFMARPSATDLIGSSGHIHVSLLGGDGEAAFFDPEAEDRLSATARQAVAGVLELAPGLMPFYAPNVNSYKRSASEDFAGCGNTWGYDNRTVSCRVLGHSPASVRLEYRVPGADVNPYLAIAALLASIESGIGGELSPPPPVPGNAYEDEDRPRLPTTLGEASAAFQASAAVRDAFGSDVVEHYAIFADGEWRNFMSAVTDWELETYFELT